ncbi:hypothetical protein TWF706_003459 [Orbilia oligospora]|nr:hypothetical protein TWF706_003459 [Orbilia oligospora]
MEVTLIGPLLKAAQWIYQSLDTYKNLDDSIGALIEQVKCLTKSIEMLKNMAEKRRLARSCNSLFGDTDPIEQELSALLKNTDQTHDEVEEFLREMKFELKIPNNLNGKWIAAPNSTIKSFFRQEGIRGKLRVFEHRYQTLANMVNFLASTLQWHTTQELICTFPSKNSKNRLRTPKRRLDDPELLLLPKDLGAVGKSTPFQRFTEREFLESVDLSTNGSAIMENEPTTEVEASYTGSQEWLFRKFYEQEVALENFKIWYLLRKVLLWVGECGSSIEGLKRGNPEYVENYAQLMKAAWLLVGVMKAFPVESTVGQFNESVVIAVQYQIHELQPVAGEIPSLDSVQKVPRGILDLNLSREEETKIAQCEIHSFDDPSEVVIFQKAVQYEGYKREKRLIKVLFDKTGFHGDSPWFKSTTMIVDDQRLLGEPEEDDYWIQSKNVTYSYRNTVRIRYDRLQTRFTPLFPSSESRVGENSLAEVALDRDISLKGVEEGTHTDRTVEIEFENQKDAADFQHAICGYEIRETFFVPFSKLTLSSKRIWPKFVEMRNISAQIWSPKPPSGVRYWSTDPQPLPSTLGGTSSDNSSRKLPAFPRVSDLSYRRHNSGSWQSVTTAPEQVSTTRLAPSTLHLHSPEFSKLLIYGLNGDTTIEERHCCHRNGLACCESLAFRRGNDSSEDVVIITGEAKRIELPLDVQAWSGTSVKLSKLWITFGTVEGKLKFRELFQESLEKYSAQVQLHNRRNLERRRNYGL